MSAEMDSRGRAALANAAFAVAFALNAVAAVMFFWVLRETGVATTIGWPAIGSLLLAFGPGMAPALLCAGTLLRLRRVPGWLRKLSFAGAGWSLTLVLATLLGGAAG